MLPLLRVDVSKIDIAVFHVDVEALDLIDYCVDARDEVFNGGVTHCPSPVCLLAISLERDEAADADRAQAPAAGPGRGV